MESISLFDVVTDEGALGGTTEAVQPVLVEIFDPPMCCPTGLCGPTIDQTLLTLSEMLMALQTEGVSVERYQMTSHAQKFIQNPAVMQLVRAQQMAALPITLVRGEVIKIGAYPALSEIKLHLNGAAA
jgi:hypothetical protein